MRVKDIYIRREDDPFYKDDILETTNDADALVNQVRITLGTTKGTVLGESKFGVNLFDKLYDYDINTRDVSAEITQQINSFSELARIYNIDFNVNRIKTSDNRIAILADMRIGEKNVLQFII